MNLYKKLKLVHNINKFLFIDFRFYGSRKLGRKIARVILPKLTKREVICPTILGFDLALNNNGGKPMYYLGFYEMGTLHVIKNSLKKGGVFIDVGASVGLMSVFASAVVGQSGKVLAFEPQVERFSFLKKNIQLNHLVNVLPFNIGLGTKEQTLTLYTDRNSPSLVDRSGRATSEKVKIRRLEEIVDELKINSVNFIKVDVEGFEVMVLKGAEKILKRKDAPILCVEYFLRNQKISGSDIPLTKYIKSVNDYHFFQLEKTSDTVSKLIEKKEIASLEDEDNLYCLLQHHIHALKGKLL